MATLMTIGLVFIGLVGLVVVLRTMRILMMLVNKGFDTVERRIGG